MAAREDLRITCRSTASVTLLRARGHRTPGATGQTLHAMLCNLLQEINSNAAFWEIASMMPFMD